MRWKKVSAFIVAFMLSIGYFYVALLNYLAPWHAPVMDVKGPANHPWLNLLYFIVCMAITWGFYLYMRRKPRKITFIISLLIGVVLIFGGMFLWRIADKAEDTVVAQEPSA